MRETRGLGDEEKAIIPDDKAGKQKFWQAEVKRWRDSGSSQSRYSQARGLSFHQLNYWVSKLKCQEQKKPSTGQLLAVNVSKCRDREWLRLKRADGLVLEVPLLSNREALKKLLEVLGW